MAKGYYTPPRGPLSEMFPAEYTAWTNMRFRCGSRAVGKDRENYLLRGIRVCRRWRHSFRAFLADMGPRPSRYHTLDRRENDKGYNPDNCRWATQREQQQNRRNNVRLTLDGETLCVAEWSRRTGLTEDVIYRRIKNGWDVNMILKTPAGQGPRRPDKERCNLQGFCYNGVMKPLVVWAREQGLHQRTVRARIALGWSLEKALFTPLKNGGRGRRLVSY